MGNSEAIKKLLGEPIPQLVDPKNLTPHIAQFFRRNGTLERIRKKLALISRKKGGAFIPARGTIASVDEDDNIYVGVDFLEQFGDDENLLAAILAHEWGHMMSDRRKVDWSHVTIDELFAIRRDEEAEADAFSGRALFLLGYSPDSMIHLLETLRNQKKKRKFESRKYHNTATRIEIFRQSYNAVKRALEVARRLFFSSGHTAPKMGQIIGEG